jgi:hypothetical protein
MCRSEVHLSDHVVLLKLLHNLDMNLEYLSKITFSSVSCNLNNVSHEIICHPWRFICVYVGMKCENLVRLSTITMIK